MRDGHGQLNSTLKFVRGQTAHLLAVAGRTLMHSVIIGNILALIACLMLLRRLVKSSLLKLRAGQPEGKFIKSVKEESGITAIQIPKLVGMTLMSFWFSFYLLSSALPAVTILLSFVFGPWIGDLVGGFGLFEVVGETLVVFLICIVGLDKVIGQKVLLGGTDEVL